MGGGLMQLVAYGAQDIYLTGNPQITFFKVVYRRHTNFAIEQILQTLDGTVGYGNRVSCTISRNGDLVNRIWVRITTEFTGDSGDGGVAANYPHALLKQVDLEIGGQLIDRHYGHWLETWVELSELNPYGHAAEYNYTGVDRKSGVDEPTLFQLMSHCGGCDQDGSGMGQPFQDGNIYVPLQFWFCRNPGLSLPLIALQYHEVKINIDIGTQGTTIEDAIGSADINLDRFELWVDYIYLDTDERRRFAQVSHEYLIEQVQHAYFGATEKNMKLTFNHPVKELIWAGKNNKATLASRSTDNDDTGPTCPATLNDSTFKIVLNGHDRFAERDLHFFTRAQIWSHHTGYGGIIHQDSIAVYSFALKPEEHQPSGTCNFSRIDNAQLIAGTAQNDGGTHVYAVNYNVLRIMSGMGGLAYSN